MNKKLIYVHGASSTPVSFNYIAAMLPEKHTRMDFFYDSSKKLEGTIKELYEFLPDEKEKSEVVLVSHSLGGILSTGVTYVNKVNGNKKRIDKVIILSSPMAGSKAASYLKWMYPKYGLFDNVAVTNPLIYTIGDYGAILPTLSIVTSGGDTPLIKEKNDGVVSVASQMSLKNSKKVEFKLNHFEVLLSPEVVDEIYSFIWTE